MYQSIQGYKLNRSLFNLSFSKTFDCEIGQAIPTLCEEVLPGDIWKLDNQTIVKFMPLQAPVLQEFKIKTRYFFVPNRVVCLCFNNYSGDYSPYQLNGQVLEYSETPFESFITGGKDGSSVVSETVEDRPAQFTKFSFWDYLGLPVNELSTLTTVNLARLGIKILPLACYNAIYNTFFRNENFQVERDPDVSTVFRVNWEKDRFTSALAEQQRGVTPSLKLSDPLKIGFMSDNGFVPMQASLWRNADASSFSSLLYGSMLQPQQVSKSSEAFTVGSLSSVNAQYVEKSGDSARYPLLAGDDVERSLFNVSDLRLMFQTQKFLELNERAGYRYVEQLLARFGVRPEDSRVDRPIYLGGTEQAVTIGQVTQTSASIGSSDDKNTVDNFLGSFAGMGASASVNKGVVLRAKEHGWIVGISYLVPKASYAQAIDKQYFAKTRYDYYLPEFAHLSEQPIQNREIYPLSITVDDGSASDGLKAFGFQGIFDEYRSKLNKVCGSFRDNLDIWQCSRKFSSLPSLATESFFQVPSFKNLFNVQSDEYPSLVWFVQHLAKVYRKMPQFATPGLIDHA